MLSKMDHPSIWPREIVAISIAVFLLFFFFIWRLRFFVPDDLYIHARIALHLTATGHGWFNSGERVMVTSSPLWTVLLSTCIYLFGEHPLTIPLLNAVFVSLAWALASSILIISSGTQATARKRTLIYIAVFVTSVGLLAGTSVGQMETVLAICLFLAGITASLAGSQWDLTLFVLAALTRYEMVLGVLAFFVVALALRRLRARSVIRPRRSGSCNGIPPRSIPHGHSKFRPDESRGIQDRPYRDGG